MLGYKINSNFINLKRKLNLIYFKSLIKDSNFIFFFNNEKISNKILYDLKNEMSKKAIKCFVINSKYMKDLFYTNFKIFSSNTCFIFINNISDYVYISNLLNNINYFYLYNKYFINRIFNNNIIIINNFNFLHFIIFKYIYNILVIILCYILILIKNF